MSQIPREYLDEWLNSDSNFNVEEVVNSVSSGDRLVYSSGKEVFLYVDGVDDVLIAERSDYVWALCSHGGVLFDAGDYGGVFDTLNNVEVASRSSWVSALCSHDGVLYDGGLYNAVFDTLNNVKVAERSDYVWALCSHGGVLFDAGDYGIYETSSGKPLVEGKSVRALVSVSGSLADKLLEARL